MTNQYINFKMNIAKDKPNIIQNQNISCPFCDKETLKSDQLLLKEERGKMLVKNKFSTIENSFQTIVVESEQCDEHLATYPKEKLYDILFFGLKEWFNMSENPQFSSVIFFKNHGLQSGGSVPHAHMQIVGLQDIDYRKSIEIEHFEGIPIVKNEVFEWNISTKPRSEFYEFNMILPKEQIDFYEKGKETLYFKQFGDAIQQTIRYILNTLNPHFKSYNIVFYEHQDNILAKIFSRGFGKGAVNSAFLLGYNLSQVPSNLADIVHDLKPL